ncbi:MAG: evbL, partial [Actinomycetota bacterium]|nr:evbL [Actinomycetota bacterium]
MDEIPWPQPQGGAVTPEETAKATAVPIVETAAKFMLAPATYQKGGELGYEGLQFYVCGRGGALGDVGADVVTAAFVWMHPDMVRANWDGGCAVAPPRDAARAFVACLVAWASEHVPAGPGTVRLSDLAERVAMSASPAGAPLFAGWRGLPAPADPGARAVYHLNALRELRGGLHAGAVLASGLDPLEALHVRTPYLAQAFGWS